MRRSLYRRNTSCHVVPEMSVHVHDAANRWDVMNGVGAADCDLDCFHEEMSNRDRRTASVTGQEYPSSMRGHKGENQNGELPTNGLCVRGGFPIHEASLIESPGIATNGARWFSVSGCVSR
jgi:hypothetical protein